MINHLYFSTHLDGLDHPEIPAESSDPALEQEIQRLRQSKESVTNDLRISEEKVVHLAHELMSSQARVKTLEEEVSHALHGKRYLKQIRSVAELDNDIASEQSIMYFQKLNRMPREELKVHAGALRTLQIKASKAKDEMEQQLEEMKQKLAKVEKEKLRLFNKCQRYQAKLSMQSPASSSTTATPVVDNAIILDSDSEKEDDLLDTEAQNVDEDSTVTVEPTTPLINLDDEEGEPSQEFEIVDYHPSISHKRLLKRPALTSQIFGGRKRSRPAATYLIDDDDNNGGSSRFHVA